MRELLGRAIFPLLPEAMLRATGRWERSTSPIPPMPIVRGTSSRRLLIGPQAEVGQATEWVRAVELTGSVSGVSMTKGGSDTYEFPVDYFVPNDVYYWSRKWQRRFGRFVPRAFTHVVIESGFRLFGNGVSGGVFREISQLKKKGVRVALLFHGSDIRDPDLHRDETEWSPYLDDAWVASSQMGVAAKINHALIDSLHDIPIYVSTPDLVRHAPGSTWLPLVVEESFLRSPARRVTLGTSKRPKVVHAPSASFIKGSDLIEPILNRLSDEGLIDYQRVSDTLHSQMPGVYGDADIVLDQFRIGSYGLAAVEAMAMGRVVVGHVTEQARNRVRLETGLELPVVEATPRTLERVLREICGNAGQGHELSVASQKFAKSIHSGEFSAQRLSSFLRVDHSEVTPRSA